MILFSRRFSERMAIAAIMLALVCVATCAYLTDHSPREIASLIEPLDSQDLKLDELRIDPTVSDGIMDLEKAFGHTSDQIPELSLQVDDSAWALIPKFLWCGQPTGDNWKIRNGRLTLVRQNLRQTLVSDHDLESRWMDNIEWCDLSCTPVTDKGLEYLKKCQYLTTLNLEGTKTTASGRAALRAALPKCKINPNP